MAKFLSYISPVVVLWVLTVMVSISIIPSNSLSNSLSKSLSSSLSNFLSNSLSNNLGNTLSNILCSSLGNTLSAVSLKIAFPPQAFLAMLSIPSIVINSAFIGSVGVNSMFSLVYGSFQNNAFNCFLKYQSNQ